MVGIRIYCSHGLCKSNTIDREAGVQLIPFPKPCLEYIDSALSKDTNDHNPKKCAQCSKSLRWIHLCKRSDLKLSGLIGVNNRTYICTKHFPNGLGPTEIDPDPYPADEVQKTQKPARQASLDRSVQPVHPAKKKRLPASSVSTAELPPTSETNVIPPNCLETSIEGHTISREHEHELPTSSALTSEIPPATKPRVIPPINFESKIAKVLYIREHDYAMPKECENRQKLDRRMTESDSRQTLRQMAHKLLDHYVYTKYDNEKLTVGFHGSLDRNFLIEKSCVVDHEWNVQIFVRDKVLNDDHKIWSKYPKKWDEGFDFLSFFKDFSVNWLVCQSYTDSYWISTVRDNPNRTDSYKYDRITDSIRSLDCSLLASSDVCFHCKKMKRVLQAKFRRRRFLTCRRICNMSREEAQAKVRRYQLKLAQEKQKNQQFSLKLQRLINGELYGLF